MKHIIGIFTISALALNFNAMADISVNIPANPTGPIMCDTSTLGIYNNIAEMVAVYEPISISCPAGKYLSHETAQCETCLAGHFCTGSGDGKYTYDDDEDIGIEKCPDDEPHSPAGSTKLGDCGHILHIGDKQMYIHQDINTPKPRLAVRINGKTFYAPMTTESIKMSTDSNAKLHINIAGTDYTVHDNSVSE
jgi:hypothetical protein